MTSIPYPLAAAAPKQLRPLNISRDLFAVADLIELCFASTMDDEGKGYIRQMRRASHDMRFLRWATSVVDTVSLPLTGYVWEEAGRIIGNISLIPFRRKGKRIFLIANVAVHPDHRRQGIARLLTLRAVENARQRHSDAIWLHVRDDNEAASALYRELGFEEKARRTTWLASPDASIEDRRLFGRVGPRRSADWALQRGWLERLYPETLSWYQSLPWDAFRPGVLGGLYRLVSDTAIRHWTLNKSGRLDAVLTWERSQGFADHLWLAFAMQTDPALITDLLMFARRQLSNRRRLALEFPAFVAHDAIRSAGFSPQRTLIWMKATEALQPAA